MASEHHQGGFLDAIAQDGVKAVAGDRIGLAAQDAGGDVLDFHDIEQAEFAPFVVEKQIDIGVRPSLAAGGGAEQP